MKILIIGSQGFIGGHLYRYFSSRFETSGADVINKDEQDRFTLLDKENTEFDEIIKSEKFDFCINASGNGSVPISLGQPLLDFNLNVVNSFKLLEALRLHNPSCRYISLSSAAVYGNPRQLPIKETDAPLPLSPYGWHKFYTEQIGKEYYELHNIQNVNLRLFSVYGEGLRKQLFWDIFLKTQQSRHIELFGTGNETRDFIYIDDLVHAVHCVMNNARFTAEVINIASGIETTISMAASILCNEINPDIAVSFNNKLKLGDPLKWKADISILQEMGFSIKTPIHLGLKKLAQWLKESI
jgi:dTDP-glucose 4,6-dehydratase/UDP-glucose 4-epimerase